MARLRSLPWPDLRRRIEHAYQQREACSAARAALNPYVLLVLVALAQFPGLRGLAVAGRGVGPHANPGHIPGAGRRQRAHLRAREQSAAVYVAALFFVGFFNLGAWDAVYPYTSELFPTRLRSTVRLPAGHHRRDAVVR
jgi:hypothetical protein